MIAIDNFLNRVKKMTTGRSKEMRLSYEEANLLSVEIGMLLNKRLDEMSERANDSVIISGGSLKPPKGK